MSAETFDPKRFPLLAELGEDDAEVLAELLELELVAAGRKIFREGSEASGLLLIEAGRVELRSKRSGASCELGPGAALGGLSLVAIGPREATAAALEACVLWKLPRAHWPRLCEDAPRTACRILEALLLDCSDTVRRSLDSIDADA